ncbi:M1 family aminopeptidase [Cryomorphaceae bacterium 1068]|nr:M1 family aminopeptidase [Cryomorphaceae bacterium 1068]
MESRRFIQHESKSATSDVGQSYDWKYAVCKWEIDPWQRRIEGEVTNTIELYATTDSIDFDFSSELDVSGVWVDGEEASHYGFTQENSIFIKSDLLQSNLEHEIRIVYEGQPRQNNYLSFNQGFHGSSVPEIWTLSQPFGAADWWPCKMSLSDKLDSIRIEITVSAGNKAASQGVLEEVILNPDQTSTYVWTHRYPIPFYLVSMAVTNYAEFSYFAELENDTVEILNYVYPERMEDEMDRGLEIVSLMELFSDLFGEYPYASEKYGHAQASIPGGMEHSTMSTMSGLSFNLSAHELAHQWFGNKVTCGSWSDIWLNEGFATYMNGLAIEYLRPDEFDEWKAARISSITRQPDGSVFVTDTLDRDRIFNGRLSYNKGAYLLHMLRWVIGDESFFEGCRNYLNDPDHSFSYAHTDEFIQIMEEVSGKDLSEFFSDWYYGEGFPNYKIWYAQTDGGVFVKINQSPSHQSVDFFEIPIPIRLVGAESDTTVVLDNVIQGQMYFLEVDFVVNSLEFDPDRWILALSEVGIDPDINDEYENLFQAYPNPASTEVRFFSSTPISGLKTAEVYNVNGKLCKSIEPEGGILNGFRMDISELEPAVYIVRFQGFSDYSVRFIKME